jgi:neurotransmitter:Na+ symporter, NSS family
MKNGSVVRDGFGSRFGVVAAAAGSAIGFGNILRFPYQLGSNGGAAFLIVYLTFVVFLGMTGMMCEMTIGRRAQRDVVNSFRKLAPDTPWRYAGVIGIFTVIIILAYYIVLFGWSLDYFVMSIFNVFSGKTVEQLTNLQKTTISGSIKPIFYSVFCMVLTAFIVIGGIKKGIEKCAKYLMPILLLILVMLVIKGLTLPGSQKGLVFLFDPDFSKITSTVVFKALGQSLFDLSLGSGIMITYGSYISKKENLGIIVAQTAILNTCVSLLAGTAIFTAVFAYGVAPTEGYSLSYIVLPAVFQQMTGGYFFSILFFLLLCLAGLTTSISIIEVVVAYLIDNFKLSRLKATLISACVICLLSIPCALSFGVMKGVTFFGKDFFDFFDFLSGNLCNPIASLLWVTFVAWYLGYKKVKDELTNSGELSVPYFPIFITIVKYVSPIVILFVFIRGLI